MPNSHPLGHRQHAKAYQHLLPPRSNSYVRERHPGNLNLRIKLDTATNGSLRVQTTAIKKQMQAENDLSISEKKVNCFIQAVRKEVEQLDPETLAVSAEGETPLVSYYQLGSTCVDRILSRCRDKFTPGELNKLRNFINQHNEYDGVMTVVSKKHFAIKTSAYEKEIPETVRTHQRFAVSRS